jgi:anion-transporting  ArsA/GET3 family ATPase
VPPPLFRRVQLVTGKGGTGKTTLVAALALAHAARGRRPLVVELGHRASLPRVLGTAETAHDVIEILPRVHATNIDARRATTETVQRATRSSFATRALRVGPVRTFLDAAPAVTEVATLDRIRAFVDETDFDPILVDGDATGHTRMLFALHDVLASLGVSGPVAAILERTSRIFADETTAAVHVTTIPTALAIEEAVELWTELDASGRVALGHLLLDRVEGAPLEDASRARELEEGMAATTPGLASAIALLRADDAAFAQTRMHVRALARRGIGAIEIAEVERSLDRDTLCAIGERVLGSVT